MFGLPTETWKDLEAIPELARRALHVLPGGGRRITVSTGTFVPKPHTAFQWEPQLSVEEGFKRIDMILVDGVAFLGFDDFSGFDDFGERHVVHIDLGDIKNGADEAAFGVVVGALGGGPVVQK